MRSQFSLTVFAAGFPPRPVRRSLRHCGGPRTRHIVVMAVKVNPSAIYYAELYHKFKIMSPKRKCIRIWITNGLTWGFFDVIFGGPFLIPPSHIKYYIMTLVAWEAAIHKMCQNINTRNSADELTLSLGRCGDRWLKHNSAFALVLDSIDAGSDYEWWNVRCLDGKQIK